MEVADQGFQPRCNHGSTLQQLRLLRLENMVAEVQLICVAPYERRSRPDQLDFGMDHELMLFSIVSLFHYFIYYYFSRS